MFKQVQRFHKVQVGQQIFRNATVRSFSTSLPNHETKKIVITIPNTVNSSPNQTQELRLSKLHISEKDVITKDQLIASFKNSDQSMLDWKSQHEGTVLRIYQKEGKLVKPGQQFYELELIEKQDKEEEPIDKLIRLWNKLPPAAKYVIIFAIICESLVYAKLLLF